jgi:hypothetical protein
MPRGPPLSHSKATSEFNDEIFSKRLLAIESSTVSASRAVRHRHRRDYAVRANVFLRAGMEGEKKYSPPFATTHSMGSLSGVL